MRKVKQQQSMPLFKMLTFKILHAISKTVHYIHIHCIANLVRQSKHCQRQIRLDFPSVYVDAQPLKKSRLAGKQHEYTFIMA